MTLLLDLLFPPQCLNCHMRVPSHGTLCLSCWNGVKFITDPFCACCGLPFEYSLGDGALCGDCISEHPPFSQARAVFRYDESSRSLITRLKYADQAHLAAIYGTWLAKCGRELAQKSDFIVPVPLHYRRFLVRRYNQSALLAHALHKHSGLAWLPDGLKRNRATSPQPGLTRKQREDNVRGAFTINARHATALKGKSVLLIDDVMTTSATASQCTKELLKGGVSQVYVLTLARKV